MALLDSGSTTNAVSEEVVISVVNRARSRGLSPEDEGWPVRFERWDDIDGAGGIALGRHLRIIGGTPYAGQARRTWASKRDPDHEVQDLRTKDMQVDGSRDWSAVAGAAAVGSWGED